jgi:hypothetical protein
MYKNFEISDVPHTLDRSELYSVNSSQSIGDYILNVENNNMYNTDNEQMSDETDSIQHKQIRSVKQNSTYFSFLNNARIFNKLSLNISPQVKRKAIYLITIVGYF